MRRTDPEFLAFCEEFADDLHTLAGRYAFVDRFRDLSSYPEIRDRCNELLNELGVQMRAGAVIGQALAAEMNA